MNTSLRNWEIIPYENASGRKPVEEYLAGLSSADRAKVRNQLKLLREFGYNLGMPQSRLLKGHKPLRELRPKPHRIFYFLHTEDRVILLHAFEKKKGSTDVREIETAERRMNDYLERERKRDRQRE